MTVIYAIAPLRILSGRRVGGVIVPFNRRDKYNTYWTRDSDFALDMWPIKPVFLAHNLRSLFGRGGNLDNESIVIRNDGLYAEADIDEGQIGDAILSLVGSGVGAWSTGTMPHLISQGDDGYVRRWPVVEGSVVHVDEAGSLPGTTTVEHIRGILESNMPVEINGQEYLKSYLRRSRWVMEPGQVQNAGNGASADVTANVLTTLQSLSNTLSSMNDRMGAVETGLRAVQDAPAAALAPSPAPDTNPRIEVSSKYDDVSLFGMLFNRERVRLERTRRGMKHDDTEEFMRALVDKVRVAYDSQEQRVAVRDDGLRMIDSDAYQALHERVPYLRANEAHQSTLSNAGDELVPTLLSSVAHYEFRLESKVLNMLQQFQMPSQPYNYPTVSGGPQMRQMAEPANIGHADVSSGVYPTDKMTTGSVPFSAGKIGVMALVSKELMEDAGLMVTDVLSRQFIRNAARDIDYVLLNGDQRTAATNISHSADPSATAYNYVLVLDGLRRIAQANSDSTSIGTIATTTDSVVQKLMGTRGVIGLDIPNLVHIVDPLFYYKLRDLADFASVDKIADRAVLLTGQVGAWKGVPVVVSAELEGTDNNGLYPATHDGAKGQMVTVHRPSVLVGFKRQVQMEQGHLQHTDLYAMSASVRLDIQSLEAGGVGWGYNATV